MPFPDFPCSKCNSWIDPPQGTRHGAKFICPRCDDRVTWLGPDIPGVPPPVQFVPPEVTARKRITAGGIIAGMALMALIGLFFALNTQKERRDRDFVKKPKDPRESYLSWVGSDATILAAVDLEKIRASEALSPLLKLWKPKPGSDWVSKYLGYKLANLQLACIGLNAERPLGSTLIIRTKPVIEMEGLTTRLKASGAGFRSGRETMRYPVDFFPIGPTFAKLDPHTLALTLLPEKLDAIPSFPRDGLLHLNKRIGPLVGERIPAHAVAWLASQGGKLNQEGLGLPGLESLLGQSLLEKIESFAIWVEDQGRVIVRGEILSQDAQTVQKIEESLDQFSKKGLFPVKYASRDKWTTLQMELPPEAITQAGEFLSKFLKNDR